MEEDIPKVPVSMVCDTSTRLPDGRAMTGGDIDAGLQKDETKEKETKVEEPACTFSCSSPVCTPASPAYTPSGVEPIKKRKFDDPVEQRVRFYTRAFKPTPEPALHRQVKLENIFFDAMKAVQEVAKEGPHDKGRMIACIDTLQHAFEISVASIGLSVDDA